MTLLTFIIPVRHPDNAPDWAGLKQKLAQTLASIAAQSAADWRGIVVANEHADLPPLPAGFSAVRVAYPPNPMYRLGAEGCEAFYEAVRADKGRRMLRGLDAAADSRFIMFVDDDDFINRRIVEHVAAEPEANGWRIDRGFVWSDGGRIMIAQDDFHFLCGTSHIVRRDLYGAPPAGEAERLAWIKDRLGSHIRIDKILRQQGTPLASLPFRGAVYRVGHGGAHSQGHSVLRRYFLNRAALRRPRGLIRDLGRLRLVDKAARREFFAGA